MTTHYNYSRYHSGNQRNNNKQHDRQYQCRPRNSYTSYAEEKTYYRNKSNQNYEVIDSNLNKCICSISI